jgi:hypothetical protein
MAKKYTFLAVVIVGLALSATTLTGQVRINGIWSNWFSNALTLASTSNGQMLTQIKAGSADPEGAVTAPAGSIYMRTNGTVYKKSSGSGNTGWDAFAAGVGSGDALTTDTLAQFAATSCAQFATVISGETGTCGSVVLSAGPTFTGTVTAAAVTLSGALTLPDNVRVTFNPGADAAGLNIGAQTTDPGTPSNGDLYYDSDDHLFRARNNGAWVSLGAGGGGLASTDIDTCAEFAAIMAGETGTCGGLVLSAGPTFTGTVTVADETGTGVADWGGATSFEIPNAAAPTVNAAGEIALDTNYWGATGGFIGYDGANIVGFVGVLSTDTCTDGQVVKYNATPDTWTCEDDANSGAATEFDDIADPSGNGAIALAGTTHAWTSTLDSGIVLSITDTDADAAADTTLLKLLHNDGADANVIFLHLVGDADGTPVDVFKVSETAASFAVDLTVPTEAYDDTGWNGDLTVPTKDAIRDVIATIATFTDPNADKFIFWDDSAGAFVALDMPAAFSISNTTATLTLPYTLQFTAAVCQNATASLGMSTPSSVAATAGCITVAGGSGDAALGYAVFATGGADTELHGQFELGSDWTGAVDATIKWMSNSTAAGDVVWEIAIGCVANDEVTGAPTFDDTAFTADANHTGAALRLNTATKTGLTVSTCSAGETAMFIIHRDTDTAGDTLDQDVRLVSITFTLRRSVS